MRSPAETKFHLLMSTLCLGSVLVDQELPKLLPQWRMPAVGLVTCMLGLCWVALFCVHRLHTMHGRIEVLKSQLEQTMRRADALEADARARRGLPLR